MDPIRTEADVDALLRSAKALAVIAAWSEQGLFSLLAEGPRRLDELPGDPRALRITAPVLKHLGLLDGDGERLALSFSGRRMHAAKELPPGTYLELLRRLSTMGEVLREGGPMTDAEGKSLLTDGGVRRADPEDFAGFLDMLYRASEPSAQEVYDWIAPRVPAEGALLDVGGGHGRYARTFADSGRRAAIFDFPEVIEYARERHGDALDYLAGNFRDPAADFGGPYDLIFLSNIVHGEPDAENVSLLRRLAAALKPGGWIVLKDMFIDELGCDPEKAVFFGLTMLSYTKAGESPTLEQGKRWFDAAGLGNTTLSVHERYQLLSAQKG